MDSIPCVDRVSEYPAGSREWFRDWSAFWMREAQGAARVAKVLVSLGCMEPAESWRRMAISRLRDSLRDYKRSFDAPDASEWPGFRP